MMISLDTASSSELRARWAKDRRHTRLLSDADRERRRARGRRARQQEAEQLGASAVYASDAMTVAGPIQRLQAATQDRPHRHLRLVINNHAA